MERSLAVCTVLMLAFGGCVGGAGAEDRNASPAPTGVATKETGAIEGSVVTDEIQPIESAQVAILRTQHAGRTGRDGAFAISGVEPGSHTVLAGRLGYFDASQKVEVKAGEVTRVQIILDRVPVSEPSFNETMKFEASLTVGDVCDEGEGDQTKGITWTDFAIPINASKPDGTPLAAVNIVVDLKSTPSSATIDVDMYLYDPSGKKLAESTSPGPNENVEYDKLLTAGEHRLYVCLWAGALAEFKITATITYEQGESALYAREKSKK